MHSTRKVRWAFLLATVLLPSIGVFASETDDYVPEVTDRVARISFIQGDVQIRRADRQDWEVAVLNLPIVEGDEIATDGNGRFEIQFNSYTHLRVAENAQIQIVGLKDEGIAISVPIGTVTLRSGEFDGSRSFFEIDAPKTTISIQKAGMYRVESGVTDSLEVFVSATDGGEARVYSTDGGFTLKNGRRATIYVAGERLGEWDMADASRFADEFDSWSLERDAIIANRVRDAYYDRYYDRDIYGAEDLNDYGEWVHTRKYGYVWRPYSTSISQYSDWSPYRYGHWRWIPPFGWTWVNDEPWGWATYHHGRWVWDNGGWYWTPYGYYRHRRSWWHPALVVVRILGGNVCWYPLPYRHRYYDYNSYYYSHYPRRRRHQGNYNQGGGPVAGNPTPTPAPSPGGPVVTPIRGGRDKVNEPPLGNVPAGGVVTVPVSEFGRGKGRFGRPPLSVATNVLSKVPDEVEGPPILPTINDLNGKISAEIRSVRTPMLKARPDVPTGATPRRTEAPLDRELQKTRIFGGRPPLQINTSQGEIKNAPVGGPRKTGAVERPAIKTDETPGTPIIQTPLPKQDEPVRPVPTQKQDAPVRQFPKQRQDPPVYSPPVQKTPDEPVRPPRYDPPPTKRDTPRDEPVRPPRYEPPAKRDDPPPRSDPPAKRDDPPPRSDPPKRSDPPPQKSEPSKPAPQLERKKDGR